MSVVQIPASNPEEPALREPSRRSRLRSGTLLGASAATGSPVFAGRASAATAVAPGPSSHLVLNYQPSQPTGWGQGSGPTAGGHTVAKDFTFQGTAYRISLLSFSQRGNSPGPVYEDVPDTWACPRCGQTADEHYEDGRCLTEPRLGVWLVTTITNIAKVVGFFFLGAIILFALRWAYT